MSPNKKPASEEELRKHRCCIASGVSGSVHRGEDDIKVDLENEILSAVKNGYTTFITGMSRGPEIWAGNIVVRLKSRFPELKLIAALPYPAYEREWDKPWLKKYEALLQQADYIRTVSPAEAPSALQERNRWMVDHSSFLIAVGDGRISNPTIRYAKENSIPVRFLQG